MRQISYILGIIASYSAVVLLLVGQAIPEFRENFLSLTLGFMVVGCLMLLWHVAGMQSQAALQGSSSGARR